MATVKVRDNGPLVIDGDDVQLIDNEGNAFSDLRCPLALCRCGLSTNKPFCDGAHQREGFESLTRAGS
mgnify:CR=1 FL=1